MITESFSLASEPIITPALLKGRHEDLADVCILTFSHVIFENAVSALSCRLLGFIKTFEHMRQPAGIDADSAVPDGDDSLSAAA